MPRLACLTYVVSHYLPVQAATGVSIYKKASDIKGGSTGINTIMAAIATFGNYLYSAIHLQNCLALFPENINQNH